MPPARRYAAISPSSFCSSQSAYTMRTDASSGASRTRRSSSAPAASVGAGFDRFVFAFAIVPAPTIARVLLRDQISCRLVEDHRGQLGMRRPDLLNGIDADRVLDVE